jgi:hypothetical protein
MRIALSVFTGFTLIAPFLATSSVTAQESNFQPRFNTGDRDAREGYCKLRIRVDNVTDVIMFGDRVTLRTVRGRPSFDVGSECSSPLPRRGIVDFDFRQTDGPGRANVVDAPDRGDGRVVIHVVDPGDGDHKYTLEFRWRATHRQGWGNWDGDGGGGFAPPPPPPQASFGMDRAIGVCQDVVKDRIWNQYHYRDADFFHVRADEGRRGWIIGDVVARRRDDRMRLRFECDVDYREGRVRNARVWPSDRDRDR